MPFGIVDAAVVGDRRAHDHEIARQGRRRGDRVVPGPDLADALPQRHLAAACRSRGRAAGRGVDREEPRLDGGREDAAPAGAPAGAAASSPAAHAARGELGVLVAFHGGVEAPALGARLGVEGEHAAHRRRQHEQAVHQDRRGLERHVVGRGRDRRRGRRCGSARRPRGGSRCCDRSGRAASSAGRRRRRRRTASRSGPPPARRARATIAMQGEACMTVLLATPFTRGMRLATSRRTTSRARRRRSAAEPGSGSPWRWRANHATISTRKRAATAGSPTGAKWPLVRALLDVARERARRARGARRGSRSRRARAGRCAERSTAAIGPRVRLDAS